VYPARNTSGETAPRKPGDPLATSGRIHGILPAFGEGVRSAMNYALVGDLWEALEDHFVLLAAGLLVIALI
jgi:hypothetical protein